MPTGKLILTYLLAFYFLPQLCFGFIIIYILPLMMTGLDE